MGARKSVLDSSFLSDLKELVKDLREVPRVQILSEGAHSEVNIDEVLNEVKDRLQEFDEEIRDEEVWCVDGGTRWLKGPAPVVVTAVTASGGLRELLAYPNVGFGKGVELEAPVVVAPSKREFRGLIRTVPLVNLSPLIEKYEGEYKVKVDVLRGDKSIKYAHYDPKTMHDENRLYSESMMLREVLNTTSKLVIVDGPLFPTPAFFLKISSGLAYRTRKSFWMEAYALSYLFNIYVRLDVIGNERGRVVGFVKRLNRSHKLTGSSEAPSDEEIMLYVTRDKPPGVYYLEKEEDFDVGMVVNNIFKSNNMDEWARWGVEASDAYRVQWDKVLWHFLSNGKLKKHLMYVVIKERKRSVTFRLESLEKEIPKRALSAILGWTFAGSKYPLPLVKADEAAKRLGKALASIVRAEAQKFDVLLSEVEEGDV